MAKRVVKKTKIKMRNFLMVLLVFLGLFFVVAFSLRIKTKNIVIKGNNYLNDDYVIDLAGVRDYPYFILLKNRKIEKRLNSSNYIYSCTVRKKIGFVLEINVLENKALFYNTNTNKYVLSNNEVVSEDGISHSFRVPRLLNYVPDKKYSKFVTGVSKIKDDILSKISDIEYKPNDFDKDRFLLYMDDGNMVYLTLTKFKMVNHYNEVLSQLEGHKGILYLDSGNHFEIKE